MQINVLSPDYAVSAQICVDDIPAIVTAGYKSIICNRPDHENHPDDHYAQIALAADCAGLHVVSHPFDSGSFTAEVVTQQRKLLEDLPGPVLAYCATGTRCSIVWSFVQAPNMSADQIIRAAHDAGYNISYLRPHLEQAGAAEP